MAPRSWFCHVRGEFMSHFQANGICFVLDDMGGGAIARGHERCGPLFAYPTYTYWAKG